MSALPTRAEFLATYGHMETLQRKLEEERVKAHAEAAKREPIWVSASLTLGVGFVIAVMVLV